MATSQWFKHDLEIVSCKHWAKSHDVLNILFFRFHESQYPIKKKETAWTSPVPKAKLPMCWWLFCYKAPTLSSCILSEEHHSCLCFSLPYVACLFWHHWPLLIPFSIFTLILSRQWWSGPCSLGTTSGNSSVWNSTNTEQWFWGMVVDNKWKKKQTFCGAKFEDPQNPPSPLKPTASMGAPRLSLLIPATSLEVSKPILRFSSSLEALMRLMIMVYYSERTQIEISKRERLTWVQESPDMSFQLSSEWIHTHSDFSPSHYVCQHT